VALCLGGAGALVGVGWCGGWGVVGVVGGC
jgi:hypothetical protein